MTTRPFLSFAALALSLASVFGQNVDLPYSTDSAGEDGPLRIPSPGEGGYNFGESFDRARQRIVLFGGSRTTSDGGSYNAETWIWDGITWSLASPSASPSTRNRTAMAYDATREQTVLFGGWGTFGVGVDARDDTWIWNGVTWAAASPTTIPTKRMDHAMVFDEVREEVVMFGGRWQDTTNSGAFFGNTFVWNGSDWQSRSSPASPSPRSGHAMAFDRARGEVVLFGGRGTSSASTNDTWIWDGTEWTQRFPATSPPARYDSAMCYDAARNLVLLFGGYSPARNDLWAWDGTNWSQVSAQTSPSARYRHGMVYDEINNKAVVIHGRGGTLGNEMKECWSWDGNAWTPMAGPNMPFNLSGKKDSIWRFSTIEVPVNVTLTFNRNPANTPVVWLASEEVRIDGVLDLSGKAATSTGQNGSPAIGGPGGFDGGEGSSIAGANARQGGGPTGGSSGNPGTPVGGNAGSLNAYVTPFGIPLAGGSGGGGAWVQNGNGSKGGGGGGAIVIAGSKDITVTGTIRARGGSGHTVAPVGGHGSGGTVRLIADRILAQTGTIDVGSSGNPGRIRLEGFVREFDPAKITGALTHSVPVEGSVLSQSAGRLFIKSIDGVGVPDHPKGSLVNPDVIFSNDGEVTIVVEALHIPDGTAVTLRIDHEEAGVLNWPTNGQVTLDNGLATFVGNVPAGLGRVVANANYTVGQAPVAP